MIYDTAGEVINQAASECGLTAVSDPYASSDPAFVQFRNLLNSAGRELLGLHEWQKLTTPYSFQTVGGQQEYPLPADFSHMIDQTNWDRDNRRPLGGPLSPQDWTYLLGGNITTGTLYISFRMAEGVMKFLPDPLQSDHEIIFEYISKNWVLDQDGITRKDKAASKDDVILYESILMVKFLKLRFLEAKGFDTTAAMNQFSSSFMVWTGKDMSAPVLSMARNRIFPYLGWRNIPETNYGLP